MSVWWKVGALLAALSLLLLGKTCYDADVSHRALDHARGRAADSAIASLLRKSDSLGRVLRVDTVRLHTVTLRWQEFRDTLLRSDTITLTRRESIMVVRADTVIRECAATLAVCLASNAVRDTVIRQWRVKWDARPKPPGLWSRLSTRALWLGAGYGLGRLRP